MTDANKYTGLITSQHANKPKFMAIVAGVTQLFVDLQAVLSSIPASYDLDDAIGDQLDVVGEWVGISRKISTPLAVYFSFDTARLGFDQGSWRGPYDPDTGLVSLDDDTYRLLIRAKIGANSWDGTLGTSSAILNSIFGGDTYVFMQDNGDMTITFGVAGKAPSAVFMALLSHGYIPLKPSTVHVTAYLVSSVSGTPLLGFDVGNQYISGFDVGSFGIAA